MLRAYRRHIVEAMLHCHERSTFIPILANTFARRTTEIDVRHAEREFGDSKYSLMKLINLMYDLITCLTTARCVCSVWSAASWRCPGLCWRWC